MINLIRKIIEAVKAQSVDRRNRETRRTEKKMKGRFRGDGMAFGGIHPDSKEGRFAKIQREAVKK